MKYIDINGKYGVGIKAIVDDEDFEVVSKMNWSGKPSINGKIYITRSIYSGGGRDNQKTSTITLHRFIMNAPGGLHIDHINGNPLDNRKSNLRFCRPSENAQNRGKQSNNTSGFKGVQKSFAKRQKTIMWRSQIHKDGKRINLGNFPTKELAYKAYCEACIKYHGEYHHL